MCSGTLRLRNLFLKKWKLASNKSNSFGKVNVRPLWRECLFLKKVNKIEIKKKGKRKKKKKRTLTLENL